jgi:hypothetical protein
VGDEQETARQQLRRLVVQGADPSGAGKLDHAVGGRDALLDIVGPGDGVAVRGEHRGLDRRVGGPDRHPYGVLGERDPLRQRCHAGPRQRQPAPQQCGS